MYKIIKQIFFPLMLILLMASCNEDPEYYTLDVPADQMKIAASEENIILERVNETEDAITFTWNKATDRGGNTKLVYYLRLYHAEMKDLQSELIMLGEDVNSMTWTVRQLNNLLYSWNVSPGDEVTVEAEVLAVVENSSQYMKPEISKVQFNVTGYDAPNKLFLTISTGDQKRSIEMTMTDNDIYHWKGELGICDFWFVRNTEKGAPAYMKGNDNDKLAYSQTGEGDAFNADRRGEYDITIDVNKLEIKITTFFINSLFMVTSKDGVESIVQLYEYAVQSDIFHIHKRFEAGTKFRFAREKDELWPAYVKGADNTKLELKGEGSEMFEITQSNLYNMVVDLNDLTINQQIAVPTNSLYLITSLGGIESTKQMEKVQADRNVFYYKVKMDAGTEFRFVTEQNNKWPAYVKGADNSELVFREGGEMFKVNTTATYTMSVNMENMSMKLLDVYDSPTGVIAVVGGVISVGWDAGEAINHCSLTPKDLLNRPEVISYTGQFTYNSTPEKDDDNAFKFVGNGNWGHSLFATESYVNPFDPDKQSVSTNSAGDRKWKLPEGTKSGIYTLELNLHTMRINLVKQ